MKNHLIIGNPISHSLSPKIHNYWFKENKINANYIKISPNENEVEKIIKKIKSKEIFGMNVTVPFKQFVIPFLETKSEIAKKTNSVNTILNKDGKIHGENTDVYGFEKSIINNKINLNGKSALIFGAGGVVPSIISALINLKIDKIFISNRTLENAKLIKNEFNFVEIVEWGKIENCDLLINSTSVGLNSGDNLGLNLKIPGKDKIFYDVIYNPIKTDFLLEAEKNGHRIINGRDMFLYQAQQAFNLWHNLKPEINQKLIKYLYND
tara:strand:+ start:2079 stop:2876 length:798 start_codon:yes stop_codon:yes gene_type:complete